jgi:AraC-like DNA-binding protein
MHTSLRSSHQLLPAPQATVAERSKTVVPHPRLEPSERQSEHHSEPPATRGSGGMMVFDHKGRLVKADAHAEFSLSAMGVELSGRPRLRIDALDASHSESGRDLRLPGWLDSDWIEPVMEGSERLGTIVEIPERFYSRALLRQSGLPGYKLRRAMDFIRSHLDQPILLEQVAASVALSPFHFHREFKRSTGLTPHQYIVQLRMERAKALLSDSDMPLAEVAAQVGFADQSHFSSTFRRATSMTPRSYRNATAGA